MNITPYFINELQLTLIRKYSTLNFNNLTINKIYYIEINHTMVY